MSLLLASNTKGRAHKMPPMGSRTILSMALGPRHVLMTSATVCRQSHRSTLCPTLAATMLAVCALRPCWRSGPVSVGDVS